jgi:hypothetical protein
MELITRQLLAKKVAEAWKSQYFKGNKGWAYTITGDADRIYNKLVALGNNPNPDAVDSIIGNNSWTRIECDVCHESNFSLVEFDIPNHDDDKVQICADCIDKAYHLIHQNDKEAKRS